jgi:hypothetical protein
MYRYIHLSCSLSTLAVPASHRAYCYRQLNSIRIRDAVHSSLVTFCQRRKLLTPGGASRSNIEDDTCRLVLACTAIRALDCGAQLLR